MTRNDKGAFVMAHCAKHGDYRARRWTILQGAAVVGHCPKCLAELDQAARQQQQTQAEHAFVVARSLSGIPLRYKAAAFDTFTVSCSEQAAAIAALRRYALEFDPKSREQRNVTFMGDPGTGKTHLACALANAIMQRGFTALYLPVPALITQYEDAGRYERESHEDFFARLRSTHLLVLDEVGLSGLLGRDATVLHRVIDERYGRCAPTCFVTNAALSTLGETVGARIMRRAFEDNVSIQCEWRPYKRAIGVIGATGVTREVSGRAQ